MRCCLPADTVRRLVARARPFEAGAAVDPPPFRLPDEKRRAAVLVALVAVQSQPAVLFTKRTSTVGTHKGQVSFPGGHIDEGETDVEAALREADEEVGLSPEHVQIVGRHHKVRAVTNTIVSPIIGVVKEGVGLSDLTPNHAEVEQVFAVRVCDLLDPAQRSVQLLSRGGGGGGGGGREVKLKVPVFHGGPEPIWGLTAFILDQVLRDVVAPAVGVGTAGGGAALL